jgi:hypothetical protein
MAKVKKEMPANPVAVVTGSLQASCECELLFTIVFDRRQPWYRKGSGLEARREGMPRCRVSLFS